MSPKHFALVTLNQFDPYLRDGGCRGLVDYLRSLQSQGARVSIQSLLCEDYTPLLFSETLADPGTAVVRGPQTCRAVFRGLEFVEHRLPVTLSRRLSDAPVIRRQLLQALAEIRPDGVLTTDEAYEPLFAAWWLKLPGGHFFNAAINVDRCARNRTCLPFLKSRTVFANSRFTQTCIRERLDVEAAVWYYPHDLAVPDDGAVRGRTFTIGYSASLGIVKGDAVVAELSRYLPQYPIIIVGANFSQAGQTLPPNIAYWGHIPDMGRFFRQIDVLVVPSLCEEAFPRVALEAAAYGIPVIGNRVGGIPEALGESGILVDCALDPPPDPVALADRYAVEIGRLFEDDGLYNDYRRRALGQAETYRRAQHQMAGEIYQRYFV